VQIAAGSSGVKQDTRLAFVSFSACLSSAERAKHFLETPEPLVHNPSAAVFAEGTVQPLILPNHCLPFFFSVLLLLLLRVASFLIHGGEHVLDYLRSRYSISYCFPHQANSGGCHMPWHPTIPAFCWHLLGSLTFLFGEASPVSWPMGVLYHFAYVLCTLFSCGF